MPLMDAKRVHQLSDANSQGTVISAAVDANGDPSLVGMFGASPAPQYKVGVAPNVAPGADGRCGTDAANGITLSTATPSLNDIVRALKRFGLIA